MSATAQPDVVEVHYEPDCAPEQVMQVLSALDRWSGRTARHITHSRTNDRHNYRTTVILEPGGADLPAAQITRHVFHVPTRNVSKAGLGFIAPPVFLPRLLSDATPLLRADVIFRVGTRLKVKLGPANGRMPTLSAVIMRLRPVHFGFFDVGVRFVAREGE
jgi:hypothetical protein